ncbi:MAG: lysine--tRNA ligase [bacterium]
MASLEELRQVRINKLNLLKEKGINPYPIESHIQYSLKGVSEKFEEIEKSSAEIVLGGRIMSLREQGAIIFTDLFDGTARFQVLVHKEKIGDDAFDLFSKTTDIGDFIEVSGTLFVTKRGQQTIEAHGWTMLSKSLRPLPEKWHGLQDTEERFRRRYLDTLMDEEVRNRFLTRSKIVSTIRRILDSESFVEVETPILQGLAGGATALPFKTHFNALDEDFFLRIAPELFLKKLLIGGFPKVYEIGRNFRNEGIDVTHNPEFTMLEFYEAYSDASKQMVFVEKLIKEVVKTVSPSNLEKDFDKPFSVVSYDDLLKNAGVKEGTKATREEAEAVAKSKDIKVAPSDSRAKILDNIYKKSCRGEIIKPTFIVDYPADYLPLAKRSIEDSSLVSAFQLIIGGLECVKAFSELNDPIDQRERFAKGDEEKNLETEKLKLQMTNSSKQWNTVSLPLGELALVLTGL